MNRTITETKYQMFVQTIAELRKDNEKLRKALEFYADDKTYYPQGDNVCSDITMDYGSRAREALNNGD